MTDWPDMDGFEYRRWLVKTEMLRFYSLTAGREVGLEEIGVTESKLDELTRFFGFMSTDDLRQALSDTTMEAATKDGRESQLKYYKMVLLRLFTQAWDEAVSGPTPYPGFLDSLADLMARKELRLPSKASADDVYFPADVEMNRREWAPRYLKFNQAVLATMPWPRKGGVR